MLVTRGAYIRGAYIRGGAYIRDFTVISFPTAIEIIKLLYRLYV